jgi:hypothetical protein
LKEEKSAMYSSPSVYRFAQSVVQLRSVQNFLRGALASFAAFMLAGFFVAEAKRRHTPSRL